MVSFEDIDERQDTAYYVVLHNVCSSPFSLTLCSEAVQHVLAHALDIRLELA